RNHATVFRHVLRELFGAYPARDFDDLLLVGGDERAQYQLVGDALDNRQVGQGLTGHLRHALTSHQSLHLQMIGHPVRCPQHHAFEHYSHLRVVYPGDDLLHHSFEGDTDKLYPMGSTVLHPQIERDLLHCQLVFLATQIEEAVMGQQPAADALEAGHGRIESARDEGEDAILTSQGISSQPRNGALHHEEVIVVNFNADRDFRIVQLHLGPCLPYQPRTNMALNIHGIEAVDTLPLAAHRKGPAG